MSSVLSVPVSTASPTDELVIAHANRPVIRRRRQLPAVNASAVAVIRLNSFVTLRRRIQRHLHCRLQRVRGPHSHRAVLRCNRTAFRTASWSP